MHRNKYYRSKLPVWLVLLYLVNVLLIVALEALVLYPFPAAAAPEDFAAANPAMEGCTLIDQDATGSFRCYLLRLPDGEYRIVPTVSHSLFSNRAKVLKMGICAFTGEADTATHQIRSGIHTNQVSVSTQAPPHRIHESRPMYINIDYAGSSSFQALTTVYMAIAAILECLELALWQLLKGNHE